MQQTMLHQGIYTDVNALLNLRALARDFKLESRLNSSASRDGDSRSTRRGRGMEFSEVRPYQIGDDVRNIDWRVTARTQVTYTKLFQEEKERPVFVLVDQRSPMFFGSQLNFKSVLAAELGSFIAWCTLNNRDKLGAMVFSDNQQSDLRPKRGKHATLKFLHDLAQINQSLTTQSHAQKLSLNNMLLEVLRVARPGSLIYAISDFHDVDEACKKTLSLLSRHNDLELLQVYDDFESQLPANAVLPIKEGMKRLVLNTANQQLNQTFHAEWENFVGRLKNTAYASGARLHSLSSAQPCSEHVQKVFRPTRTRRGHQ